MINISILVLINKRAQNTRAKINTMQKQRFDYLIKLRTKFDNNKKKSLKASAGRLTLKRYKPDLKVSRIHDHAASKVNPWYHTRPCNR